MERTAAMIIRLLAHIESCTYKSYLLSASSRTETVYIVIVSAGWDDQSVVGSVTNSENPSSMSLRLTGIGELKTRTISNTCKSA